MAVRPALAVAIIGVIGVNARTFQMAKYYMDTNCSTPSPTFYIGITYMDGCVASTDCQSVATADATYYRMIGRTEDVQKDVKGVFGSTNYVMVEEFDTGDITCTTYNTAAEAFSVGSCIVTPNETYQSVLASQDSGSGSSFFYRYTDDACENKGL
ncbi:hypothetical protein BBJ28_00026906, partial [Nothophytophthora sp. Chile5]